MTIKNIIRLVGLVILLLLIAGSLLAIANIHAVRIGGSIQSQTQSVSDLVADILPPPEYIIEPYLEATLVVNEPRYAAPHLRRLERLRDNYMQRHRFWREADLPPELKTLMVETSAAPALRFWREFDTRFLPAANALDTAALVRSYALLSRHYLEHRAAIDATVSAAREHQAAAQAATHRRLMIALAVLLCFVATVVGAIAAGLLGMNRRIVRPIEATAAAMREIAGGELEAVIAGTGRSDEIGEMARALRTLQRNAIEARNAAEKQAVRDREQRDLERRATEQAAALQAERGRQQEAQLARAGAQERRAVGLAEMAAKFDDRAGELLKTVTRAATELNITAASMATDARATHQQTSALASASIQTSANVQSVAAATSDLSSSIRKIAQQADRSAQISRHAVRESLATSDKVQELALAAGKIDNVVGVISSIADQTNLLALNATIEAARAGDAGRGFSVVASEVKALAAQTSQATEEISAQIRGMQSVTRSTVDAILQIQGTIEEISQIATAISGAVEQQGIATQDISSNIQQSAYSTEQATANIGIVNEAASSTGAASVKVLASGTELSAQAEIMKTEIGLFLSDIQAA